MLERLAGGPSGWRLGIDWEVVNGMKYRDLCEAIIRDVGGGENVRSVAHCITRLRFDLVDRSAVDEDALRTQQGVIKIIDAGGQFQVVIGPHVDEVYQDLVNMGGFTAQAPLDIDEGDVVTKKKGDVISNFLLLISSILTPVLSILMVSGMIKALLQLVSLLGLISADNGTYIILSALGDSLFYYFPIALGWSAAKRFGIKELYGIIIGACLVYPTIVSLTSGEVLYTLFEGTPFATDVYTEFLGLPVILPAQSYASSVIPAIVMVWIASKFNHFLERVIPSTVKFFFVPFFTLIIIVPLSLLVIGPIAMAIQDVLAAMFQALISLSPGIAGFLIGGLWTILVVFGLHMALISMINVNIAQYGFDVINPMLYPGAFALLGAVLGVLIRAKTAQERNTAVPALVSQVFGVSEPLLYGVLFPRKKLTIAAFAASGVGGGIAAAFGSKLYFFGTGIFSLPCYIGSSGIDVGFIALCIGSVVAFIISLVAGLMFSKPDTDGAAFDF